MIVIRKPKFALVVRRRKGKAYVSVFELSLNDRQIEGRVRSGEAKFFPYNARTGDIRWAAVNKPLTFRR